MHSEDGETFTYRNFKGDIMIRIIKYVSCLNYNHFKQFPKTLGELTIAEYNDIVKKCIHNEYFPKFEFARGV